MAPNNKFRWISAAENCQIWDERFEAVHKFDGISGNVGDVAWNHDGKSIAIMQSVNSQIITATIGAQQIYQGSTVLPEGETATALGFANDTLVAGTRSGSILLWDQNKHKLIRSFSGVENKKPISKIQSNSSIIAAGHTSGGISIYGIKTGQMTGQYSIANSAGLRDLKISSVKSSIMAASFNSGTVAAWNTNSKTNSNIPIFEITGAHQSPATCVALSPVTDILMVSGGLDKCILLYDLPKKKTLKRIEADAPITAIDFFPDGTSLIVGTNRGKILIYDLRSISTPIQTIAAHSSCITKLICRPYQGGKLELAQKPAAKSNMNTDTSSTTKAEPMTAKSENSGKQSHFPFPSAEKHLSSDFGDDISPITPVLNRGSSRTSSFPPNMDPASVAKELEHRNSSLFSPLKGEVSDTMLSSPSFGASPFLKYNKTRDLRVQEETRLPTNTEVEEESEMATSASFSAVVSPPESAPRPPPEDTPLMITDSVAAAAAPQAGTSSEAQVPVDFQAEFIRRIVHDVEENLREVLRCRFGDLIIQSAQQFLTLQTEIEQLKQQVQDKAYLEEEVRRLRSEVNHLRNLY